MMRFVTLLALLLVWGCTTPLYEEANRLSLEGKAEEAVVRLERLVAENPRNPQYRAALLRERERAVAIRVSRGDVHLQDGRVDDADREYGAALGMDPNNARVAARRRDVERARRHVAQVAEAKSLLESGKPDPVRAERILRGVLAEAPNHLAARDLLRRAMEAATATEAAPQLKAPFAKPVTLEFRDASLKTVFDLLARTSGINFVFDRDVRQDTKLSVFLRNTSLDDALKLILTTNQLDRKVLNENSVLIYPNTPAKQKDYRELVVRSFYLANTDVKQASAMIKAMVKTQDVFIDEKLNLLVIKDTPEVVRLADQLVRTLDVAEPEVMLEVEVLEVTRSRLQQLGIDWPKSVSLGAAGSTTTTTTTATTQPIDGPMVFRIANPALTFNLNASVSGTNLLANPRIRAKNKEKARIHIGDKVPVFTSTATANVGVSTSVTYLDVGLKLDVEPQVYLNDDVAIKIGLEVSNIVEEKTVSTGTGSTIAYRIGTRNTNTVLQLRDGETQILAGLINDEDRRSSSRIPGLGDLPLLNRIFGTQTDNKVKTEIVLLITPRIVRNVLRPEGSLPEVAVGTDTTPGLPPLRIAKTGPGAVSVGAASADGSPAPAPQPETPPSPVGFQLRLAAPAQVRPGASFTLTVGMPEGIDVREGFVEIAFDPAVVQPVGVAGAQPGRVQLTLERFARGNAEVTFRAAGEGGAASLIAVSNAEFVDSSGFAIGVVPPPPVSISVAK